MAVQGSHVPRESGEQIENDMNTLGRQGWEVISLSTAVDTTGGTIEGIGMYWESMNVHVVCRRPVMGRNDDGEIAAAVVSDPLPPPLQPLPPPPQPRIVPSSFQPDADPITGEAPD